MTCHFIAAHNDYIQLTINSSTITSTNHHNPISVSMYSHRLMKIG